VIVDTAGRLHTQVNLMNELAKVRRVIDKQIPGAPHETLLVIDATTGQNGLRQAQVFAEAVEVTGVVLTKLDGSAKGGIVIAIREELGIPIKLIGVGERLEDLRPFDPDEFARALFLDDARARERPPEEGAVSVRLETPRLVVRDYRRPISTTSPRSSPTPRCSGGSRSPSRGSGRLWLDEEMALAGRDGTGRRAVVLRQTGKVIGGAGLVWRDLDTGREIELGYHLHRGYWGQGYATEAGAACLEPAPALGADARVIAHLHQQPALRGGRPPARHETPARARVGRPAASPVGRGVRPVRRASRAGGRLRARAFRGCAAG
jgi:RimJ/RimL family protein N-acetyltransferase